MSQRYDSEHLAGQYAGFISRIAALVVDSMMLSIALSFIALVVQALSAFIGVDLNERPSAVLVSGALLASLLPLYSLLFWSLGGQTPGKMLMGLRIVDMQGRPIRARRAVRRVVAFWLVGVPLLLLGTLLVLADNRRQSLHDKLAGTLVVYDRRALRFHAKVMRDR